MRSPRRSPPRFPRLGLITNGSPQRPTAARAHPDLRRATGFAILATLDVGSSYWHFLAGHLPFGAGMALAGAAATTAIVASRGPEKQGVASAVNDVSRELGIAVLGSVMTGVYRSGLAEATHSLSRRPWPRRRAGRWPRLTLALGALFIALRGPGRAESTANAGRGVRAAAAVETA